MRDDSEQTPDSTASGNPENDEVAARYRAMMRDIVQRWRKQAMTPDDVQNIQGMIQHAELRTEFEDMFNAANGPQPSADLAVMNAVLGASPALRGILAAMPEERHAAMSAMMRSFPRSNPKPPRDADSEMRAVSQADERRKSRNAKRAAAHAKVKHTR